MEKVNIIYDFFQKTPLAFLKVVPFETIIFDNRAQYMCKYGCKNYNRKYSCPPSSLSLYDKIRKRNYKWAILFATTYEIPQELSRFKIRLLNRHKELEIQKICRQFGTALGDNGCNHLLLSGGACKACKQCGLLSHEACKKPHLKQVSMEAVGIDCQKTMYMAGFDFEMPNKESINRCGCILTNDDDFQGIYLYKTDSFQRYKEPSKDDAEEMCRRLLEENPKLLSDIRIIDNINMIKGQSICHQCPQIGTTFSCPPFSEKLDMNLWDFTILWKWKENPTKKNSYNMTLKKVHAGFYSIGFYFSLSLRDCYCDECSPCTYPHNERSFCNFRKLLAPSMQSQNIDPKAFGNGKFGIELL